MTGRLLSRHAECAFWLARYLERAESMSRILEAHTSFRRGQTGPDSWAWIIALYSDEESFYKRFPSADAASIIQYYVTDIDNPSSILASVRAARENARALRALISTDMWLQINDFYTRLLAFSTNDFNEVRLSRSCDTIKRGCYAEIGVAESTLYRDESWQFFQLGLFIERADQTSRLLDVQFAQRATGMAEGAPESQIGLWNALLRSASIYHAYRRVHTRGLDPQAVARFLIFDTRLPRSIAFCVEAIQRMVTQLRGEFRLKNAQRAFQRIEAFENDLQRARRDEGLFKRLHDFNDWVQRELILLTAELGNAFFGYQTTPPIAPEQAYAAPVVDLSQQQKMAQAPSDAAGAREQQRQ